VSETRPHLKAVGSEPREGLAGDAGAAARLPQPDAGGSRRSSWLIVALLALACLALVIQTRRVGALSGEVTRLSTELVGTRAALVAYEGRLATVREVVGDLSQRLAQLDDLVRRDPLAPAEPDASTPEAPTPPVEQ
jgi:hypothetical protein